MLMDGFGRLTPPEGQTIVSPVDPKQPFMPSPQTPPGIYGGSGQFQVFNLGGALPPMQRLEKIPSAAMETGYQLSGEESLKEVFFMWALLLFFIDTILTLFLRGVFSLRTGAAAVVLLMMGASPAFAADVNKTDLASGIYLAYIETGDQTTDYISHNGLEGLADVVNARTTIRVAGVQSVNPAKDTLYFYPFLYWPMVEGQYALSAEAARHLQNYMAQGGIILFGTRDQQFSSGSNEISSGLGTRKLREMTQGLSIPELMEVQEGHILGKSFYLLSDFPGRFAGGKLWV
jgi:hypothetical protein